jgi:transcriptional regulator GlxA family with amidase domain
VASTQTPAKPRPLVLSDLADRPERNVELAAAGIGKFRLIRLFGEPTGQTPHALQVAHRIRKARRLLEAGETIADIAAATGFVDGG